MISSNRGARGPLRPRVRRHRALLWGLLSFYFATTLSLFCVDLHKHHTKKRLYRAGIFTTAEIYARESGPPGLIDQPTLSYRFTDQHQQIYEGSYIERAEERRTRGRLSVGDHFRLHYLPEAPHLNSTNIHTLQTLTSSPLGWSFIAPLLFIPLFLLYWAAISLLQRLLGYTAWRPPRHLSR